MTQEKDSRGADNIVFLKAEKPKPQRPPSEPILNLPPVVKALAAVLILVMAVMALLPLPLHDDIFLKCAFMSARYGGDIPFDIWALVSPVTHQFLHAGFMHLAVNVAMLMAFGSALEKAIGGKRLLAIYFLSGIVGCFAHAAVYPGSLDPLIGASGAISGLFGAVVMWMYDAGMIGQRGSKGLKSLMPLILVWIGTSVFFGFFGMPGAEGQIAWVVHIGGFVAGLFLFRLVVRGGAPTPQI